MAFFLEEDTITPRAGQLPKFVDRAVATTLRYYEPQVENSAKLNAPWKDRTTNARNGLLAQSGTEGGVRFLTLSHRVPYGIYLETSRAGKYAIIMPTLEEFGPKIMETLEKILDRYRP